MPIFFHVLLPRSCASKWYQWLRIWLSKNIRFVGVNVGMSARNRHFQTNYWCITTWVDFKVIQGQHDNYPEQHAYNLAQHTDYPEQHAASYTWNNMLNTQSSIPISQSNKLCDSYSWNIRWYFMPSYCLNTRVCTSTTSWIEFFIAMWWFILAMSKMMSKMSPKRSKWLKNVAKWARIWSSEACLAVHVTIISPQI